MFCVLRVVAIVATVFTALPMEIMGLAQRNANVNVNTGGSSVRNNFASSSSGSCSFQDTNGRNIRIDYFSKNGQLQLQTQPPNLPNAQKKLHKCQVQNQQNARQVTESLGGLGGFPPGFPFSNNGPGVPFSNNGPGIPFSNNGPGIPFSNNGAGTSFSNNGPRIPFSNNGPGIPFVGGNGGNVVNNVQVGSSGSNFGHSTCSFSDSTTNGQNIVINYFSNNNNPEIIFTHPPNLKNAHAVLRRCEEYNIKQANRIINQTFQRVGLQQANLNRNLQHNLATQQQALNEQFQGLHNQFGFGFGGLQVPGLANMFPPGFPFN